MKTHTTLGRDAIEHAERSLGMEVEFLKMAKEIAYSHQEKRDGSGYPEALSGDEIPISARLRAAAAISTLTQSTPSILRRKRSVILPSAMRIPIPMLRKNQRM